MVYLKTLESFRLIGFHHEPKYKTSSKKYNGYNVFKRIVEEKIHLLPTIKWSTKF